MPITRYEIRNEYSLADPELYRAADKDDPEALLEGVAMAGLVGVLRQLGDLAEFAADIFHNLHEDVMATASRGHVLAVRVQQLEAEIPSVERAFLSQTDHSSFFYRPGVDWHPNLRPNKNVVTQGDLPRFIMDSYEECRPPPRLFLLDKFDVAGAGACLKRYTDPSFFKVETSGITTADIQREKKIRKAKKKGPRWKNREIPEVVPTSHTKLHQLFLEEELVENGVSTPSRRAKLKRRLNGFPFDSKTGKSYMEEILKSPSPDHEVLHDMTGDSLELKLATNDHMELGSEIFEFRPVNPDTESAGRKRSTRSSPDTEGVAPHSPMYDPDQYPIDDKVFEVSSSHPRIATDGISSTLDNVTGEKVLDVDAESNREGSLIGYESDDMASEIDNFVDAPSTMESEMERDSNLRMTNDETSDLKMELVIEEALHSSSPDSRSTRDSTMSDGGNNSSTKEISSFTSDSPDISTEKSQSESFSSKGSHCADMPINMIVNASSFQETAAENFLEDHHSRPVVADVKCTETDPRSSDHDEAARKYLSKLPESDEKVVTLDEREENANRILGPSLVVSDGTCTETIAMANLDEFEQVISAVCISGSMPILELSDPEEASGNFKLEAPGSYDVVSTLDDIEKINMVIDPPCSPSATLGSETGDDLSRSSDGGQLVDGPNGESEPCYSAEQDIYHHNTDSSVKTSSSMLHEDESDREDQELADDAASTLNIPIVPTTNGTPDTMSSGNWIPDKFEDEFPEVPENFLSDYPVAANIGDNFESKRDHLIGTPGDEESNVSTDSLNHFPSTRDASPGKDIEETLFSARTLNVEDNHCNSSDHENSFENLNLSHLASSPKEPMDGRDLHEGDVTPEEDIAVNETLPLSKPCEAVGLQGTGISYRVSPNDSEAPERTHSTSEDLEEPGTSDSVEMDGISTRSVCDAQGVTQITSSADLRPANEIHASLNKSGSEASRSNSVDITSPALAVSDDANLSKLVEEQNDCFDESAIEELENDNNCHSECHGKLDLEKKLDPAEFSAPGFGRIGCNSLVHDHPKSELSGSVPSSHLDLEFDHSAEFVRAAKIQSPVEKCGLDRELELFSESSLENHVADAPSLPVATDTEQSLQDNIVLPHSALDENLMHPVEKSSEVSPLLPINYLQIQDDDDKGESNLVSAFSLANGLSPPSVSELSRFSNNEINVPGYPKDSVSPASNPFLEGNQINLADLPPLPPLPPVQWRMGKLQHALPSAEEETVRNEESFSQLISLTTPTDDVGSTLSTKPAHDGGASLPTASTDETISLHEEMKNLLTEVPAETTLKEENLDYSCSNSDVKTLHETNDHSPKIENKPQLLDTPISESVSTSSAAEDAAGSGSPKVKFPRPRNPLVDDISFLDKSKLRKVTERVRPEIQKVEERDSLLEQIRTKSFNLRPAMASRPSMRARGPNTNLKVVAILEKANAIRQALAGSDEDDDDSWSE